MDDHFQELRNREEQGTLTDAERAELAHLTHELEAAEARCLEPATERMQQEREVIEAQNRDLERLVRRKEALVQKLRTVLAESQMERRAIEAELAGVLAGPQGAR